jgi:hypothetical protein
MFLDYSSPTYMRHKGKLFKSFYFRNHKSNQFTLEELLLFPPVSIVSKKAAKEVSN